MLTVELPQTLQENFEQTAQALYGKHSTEQAIIEAIELWLTAHRQKLIQVEAEMNNQAFEKLKSDLEQNHLGKWAVIAYGKLEGIGNTLEDVTHLADTASCRIITQIGEQRPKEVELGWQMTFV